MPLPKLLPDQLDATNSPSDLLAALYNAATKKFSWLGVLLLDQTTPQTIANGVPLMTTEVDPEGSEYQLVNKKFVEENLNLTQVFYFHASGVMSTTLTESETYDAETLNATPVDTLTLFYKSEVADTATPMTIPQGSLVNFHFNAKVSTTTGVKAVTLQMRLFYVDADGTSNKTAVCGLSDVTETLTTTKTYYEVHGHVSADITVPSGKRLWVEGYANTSGVSVNYPDLWLYRDSVVNHISFSVVGTVLANYVQKSSADWVDLTDAGDSTLHYHASDRVDANQTFTDVATNNASTTAHGFLIKATAPASGVRNVVAIDNGETVYKNTALLDSTNPAAVGTAAPGTSLIAARRDHVHAPSTTIKGRILIPFGVYGTINPVTTSASIPYAATIDRSITLKSFAVSVYVDGTNDSSNYWTVELQRITDGTSYATISTQSSGAGGTWRHLTSTPSASLTSSDIGLRVICNKTGSPGSLFVIGPMLEAEA